MACNIAVFESLGVETSLHLVELYKHMGEIPRGDSIIVDLKVHHKTMLSMCVYRDEQDCWMSCIVVARWEENWLPRQAPSSQGTAPTITASQEGAEATQVPFVMIPQLKGTWLFQPHPNGEWITVIF